MLRPSWTHTRCIVFLCVIVCATACVSRIHRRSIVVEQGATVEDKVEFAKSFVSESRFAQLKEHLKRRLPGLTDTQLENLGVRWDVTTFKSFTGQGTRRTVRISVLCREAPGLDANSIVSEAIAILEPEINPPAALPPGE